MNFQNSNPRRKDKTGVSDGNQTGSSSVEKKNQDRAASIANHSNPTSSMLPFLVTDLTQNSNTFVNVNDLLSNVGMSECTSLLPVTTSKKHTTHPKNESASKSDSTDKKDTNDCNNAHRIEYKRINRKLDSLEAKMSTILENQTIMSLNQAALSNMFEEFMKSSGYAKDLKPDPKKFGVDFSIIEKEDDLENFEHKLQNPVYRENLERKFSILSGRDDGNGINIAYRLIDLMFSREFMTQCSWSGGSREDHVKKVCFKMFQRTLDFFFTIVRATDHYFTMEDCENFFKRILRNAKRRSLHMNVRQSTKRNRPKRFKEQMHNKENDRIGSDDDEKETEDIYIESTMTIEEEP